SSGITAKVTLGAAALESASNITCTFPSPTYTAKTATFLKIPSPGVLAFCRDAAGYPLKVAASPAPTLSGGTLVTMDPNGGFIATVTSGTASATLSFSPQNSQGVAGAPQSVPLSFPTPSNLQVNVLDAKAYNNCNGNSTCLSSLVPFADYRWIIEEDKTFWVDPNCTTNNSITTPGCPAVVGGAGTTGSTVPVFGVN